jgi:predicted adenylyl cyclase CyaB
LRELLSDALGVRGVINKIREVYLAGRTRIHLDRVEGLGEFIELEVVLEEHENVAAGMAEANSLMEALGIAESDLIASAYADLLESIAREA